MDMSKIFSLSYNAGLVDKLLHESILSHNIFWRRGWDPCDGSTPGEDRYV